MSFFGLFGPPNVEKLKAKNDVQGLIKALGYEKDSGVRSIATEALGKIRDARAVALVEALKDEEHFVREKAAEALSSLGWKPENDVQRAYQAIALCNGEDGDG